MVATLPNEPKGAIAFGNSYGVTSWLTLDFNSGPFELTWLYASFAIAKSHRYFFHLAGSTRHALRDVTCSSVI
jgi:hypothetical protein